MSGEPAEVETIIKKQGTSVEIDPNMIKVSSAVATFSYLGHLGVTVDGGEH